MTIEEETEQLEEAIKGIYLKLRETINEGEENFKSSKNYVAQLEINKRLLKINRNLKKCSSRLLELYYMQTQPISPMSIREVDNNGEEIETADFEL